MQRVLAVVAERRVAEVVGQGGGLDQVGVAAQRRAELAGDLRHLEGVGEPGAGEVVLPRRDHLGLGRQAAQRRRVQDPGPVALERGAGGPLGRLLEVAGRVARAVAVHAPDPSDPRPGRPPAQSACGPSSGLAPKSRYQEYAAVSRIM